MLIPFHCLILILCWMKLLVGHEMYNFLDGFSGYNQIPMAEEDIPKTAFITEWGAFAYTVMSFGLKNGP